jgi:hypothetical protein
MDPISEIILASMTPEGNVAGTGLKQEPEGWTGGD